MPVLSQDDLDFFDENGVRLQALSCHAPGQARMMLVGVSDMQICMVHT